MSFALLCQTTVDFDGDKSGKKIALTFHIGDAHENWWGYNYAYFFHMYFYPHWT